MDACCRRFLENEQLRDVVKQWVLPSEQTKQLRKAEERHYLAEAYSDTFVQMNAMYEGSRRRSSATSCQGRPASQQALPWPRSRLRRTPFRASHVLSTSGRCRRLRHGPGPGQLGHGTLAQAAASTRSHRSANPRGHAPAW